MSPSSRLRIAGGSRRGIRLKVPAGVRPTSEQLREALFNIWRPRLAGARFLDLFAGSGAVGLEALSRGAGSALLIEDDRRALAILERNLEEAELAGARAVRARLPGALAGSLDLGGPFDLVFADPPYGYPRWAELLAKLPPCLAGGAEVALEHGRKEPPLEPPAGLELISTRSYGDSLLILLRHAPED